MKFFIKKVISLGLWNTLDIQFANMLINTVFPSDTYCSKQYIKKSALILAIACLSAAVRSGHSCLPLKLLVSNKLFSEQNSKLTQEASQKTGNLSIDDWQELLFSLSIVGNGLHSSPLVLDNQHLYLYRMWQDEHTVAKFITYSSNTIKNSQKEKIINILNQLFPTIPNDQNIWQKVAVTIGMIHPRVFISGGPGTGKTSIVTKIITALWLLYNNNLCIKMLAPTGKSAAILTESCNLKKIHQIMQFTNYNDHISTLQATTLHSFLGYRLYKQSCEYNDIDILGNVDYLIIDEASMIGLSILTKLILLLPTKAKIIFLGDHYQLYSIEPGSVFQDICQFSNFNYSPKRQQELIEYTGYKLPDNNNKTYHYVTDGICILNKTYRFPENSGINQLANSIKLGNYMDTISILNSRTYTDLSYILLNEKKMYIDMIINCALQYCNYLEILKNIKISSTINILKTFNNYRILCALKHGPFGVSRLNYYIEQILHDKNLITLHNSKNYIGKPIIILQNKPILHLYNGDVGILLSNSQNKLDAYFFSPNNKIKIIPIHQLPKHETCFAMTIHKAQGSSFQHISIILPNIYLPILTRELLYTAVTRASKQLTLYGTNDVIIKSINHITHRYSGLYEKIQNNIK